MSPTVSWNHLVPAHKIQLLIFQEFFKLVVKHSH